MNSKRSQNNKTKYRGFPETNLLVTVELIHVQAISQPQFSALPADPLDTLCCHWSLSPSLRETPFHLIFFWGGGARRGESLAQSQVQACSNVGRGVKVGLLTSSSINHEIQLQPLLIT